MSLRITIEGGDMLPLILANCFTAYNPKILAEPQKKVCLNFDTEKKFLDLLELKNEIIIEMGKLPELGRKIKGLFNKTSFINAFDELLSKYRLGSLTIKITIGSL